LSGVHKVTGSTPHHKHDCRQLAGVSVLAARLSPQ
jgi:hypothetical protein